MKSARTAGRPWCALAPLAAMLLAACATPLLAVEDVMMFEDGRTRFVAFVEQERGWMLRGVSDVDVHFIVDGQEVATARSDERGFAVVVADVSGKPEKFEAAATLDGQSFRSQGNLVHWRSDRVIVACDIDSTISETSLQALFFEDTDQESEPIAGSPETLHEIARDYEIMYLTARPRFTLEKTRRWLESHGYPRAPVITSLTVGDALAHTRYKTRAIRSLRRHYENLLIGIGNTSIDSESYGANGMLTLLVRPGGDFTFGRHAIEFHDWEQIRNFFHANRELLRDPERLRAAVRGEEMMLIPTMRWPGSEQPD
jgi:hypothetical protein